MQTPRLVQLYDDEALASSAFDMRLHRPVHPSDLQELLAKHDDASFEPETAPLIEDQVMPEASGVRILVADDEPMNRQIVVHALEQFGYAVDVAHNGQEVLDQMTQKTYQMILMDMHMPVMDGMEATRRIRAQQGDSSAIPIIAFTASIEREQRERYMECGISAVIGKPFSLRELRQAVETWSERKPDHKPDHDHNH